jgi:hypothetical protein
MAQKARLNLTAATFPLVSTQLGQSTFIRDQKDTNYVITNNYSGSQADRDIGIPTHLYLQNVLPTTQGMKSVGFVKRTDGIPGAVFDKIFLLRDQDETKTLYSPARGKNYFLGPATPNLWQSLQFQALQNGVATHAYVNGKTYIAYKQQGLYKYDPYINNFTAVPLSGIVASSVHGVCGANNYLIVWDHNTVYWSSAIDELDFVPSLSTTSGSGKVQAARGAIVACLPIHDGFIVYTTANAIAATFSGNARFPWTFREIPGSAGVTDPEHVTYDTNYDVHFAWTSSGLLEITKQKAAPIWPELTDFLTENLYEFPSAEIRNVQKASTWFSQAQVYPNIEPLLTQVLLPNGFKVKLSFIGARYVVVSYGPKEDDELQFALVYDIGLRRWGKLKFPHIDVFLWVQPNYNYGPINAKDSFGLLRRDGAVYTVNFTDGANYDSLYLFGRIRLQRDFMTTLLGVQVENVPLDTRFSAEVLTSLVGKTHVPAKMYEVLRTPNLRRYHCRTTGLSHLLAFSGGFNFNSLEIEFTPAGRR